MVPFCEKPERVAGKSPLQKRKRFDKKSTPFPAGEKRVNFFSETTLSSVLGVGGFKTVPGTNQFVPEPNPSGHSDGRWHLACTGGPLLGTI